MSRKQNRANDDFVYSRNLFSLLLLSKTRFAYELHKPPKSIIEILFFKIIIHRKNFVKLVCISNSLKDIILSKYSEISPDSIIVCHDGADKFKGENLIDSSQRLRIAYAGSLYRGRGMKIVEFLAKRCKDMTFIIIGGKTKDLRINSENILHIPHVHHSKINNILIQCDVLHHIKKSTIRKKKAVVAIFGCLP